MESWHAIIIKVLYEYFQIAYKKKNTSITSMKKPMWTFCKKRGKKLAAINSQCRTKMETKFYITTWLLETFILLINISIFINKIKLSSLKN